MRAGGRAARPRCPPATVWSHVPAVRTRARAPLAPPFGRLPGLHLVGDLLDHVLAPLHRRPLDAERANEQTRVGPEPRLHLLVGLAHLPRREALRGVVVEPLGVDVAVAAVEPTGLAQEVLARLEGDDPEPDGPGSGGEGPAHGRPAERQAEDADDEPHHRGGRPGGGSPSADLTAGHRVLPYLLDAHETVLGLVDVALVPPALLELLADELLVVRARLFLFRRVVDALFGLRQCLGGRLLDLRR